MRLGVPSESTPPSLVCAVGCRVRRWCGAGGELETSESARPPTVVKLTVLPPDLPGRWSPGVRCRALPLRVDPPISYYAPHWLQEILTSPNTQCARAPSSFLMKVALAVRPLLTELDGLHHHTWGCGLRLKMEMRLQTWPCGLSQRPKTEWLQHWHWSGKPQGRDVVPPVRLSLCEASALWWRH